MKVYVIEKGQYSDRHVIGVVEDKDKAKKICDVLDANFSEWDTNQFDVPNYAVFEVHDPKFSWTNEWVAYYDEWGFYDNFENDEEDFEGHYVIHANSPEQAIKIAQDIKAKNKAVKEGII